MIVLSQHSREGGIFSMGSSSEAGQEAEEAKANPVGEMSSRLASSS